MTRFSRTVELLASSSLCLLGNRTLSGTLALVLVAAGPNNLGMAGTNHAVEESPLSFDLQDDEPITREDYSRMQGEMERAVKSGWLSGEEMKTKLGELRRRIAPGGSKGDGSARSFTRSDYARAKKELDGMVAEGKVSREDADKRLNRMRQAIGGNEAAKGITREEYASAEAKIKKMVAEGKVSRADAGRRLREMREAIGGNEPAKRFTREEYSKAAAKIKAMVEAGEVSAEDAEKRLSRMRQAIGGEQSAQTTSRDGYARRAEAIEKKFAEGEISREEADRMHGELRRRLAAGQRGQGGQDGEDGEDGEDG